MLPILTYNFFISNFHFIPLYIHDLACFSVIGLFFIRENNENNKILPSDEDFVLHLTIYFGSDLQWTLLKLSF